MSISIFATVLSVLHTLLSPQPLPQAPVVSAAEPSTVLRFDLSDADRYASLPVSNVSVVTSSHSWGTVLLVPQYHRVPGTLDDDPQNDRAVVAQREIRTILNATVDEIPQAPIFVEGELAGPVDAEKRAAYARLRATLTRFTKESEHFVHLMQQHRVPDTLQQPAVNALSKETQRFARTLLLGGAPFSIDTTSATLYGTEKQETLAESAEVVRAYLYAQDQLVRLQQSPDPVFRFAAGSSLMLDENLVELLSTLRAGEKDPWDSPLAAIETFAMTNEYRDLKAAAAQITEVQRELQQATEQITHAAAQRVSSAPSRSDNPYADIANPAALEHIIKEHEDKIESLVIDRRNEETAQAVRGTLESIHKNIAIIQFGSAHTEGLRNELVAQGFDVITIVPESVTLNK